MSPQGALFNGGMSLRFHRVTSFSVVHDRTYLEPQMFTRKWIWK
jgi:hypothetical protein